MTWTPTITPAEKKALQRSLQQQRMALQPALTKAQIGLDKLPPGAVILDGRHHAWQYGPVSAPYWYRAYGDDTEISSYELAQIINGKYTVIWPQEETP